MVLNKANLKFFFGLVNFLIRAVKARKTSVKPPPVDRQTFLKTFPFRILGKKYRNGLSSHTWMSRKKGPHSKKVSVHILCTDPKLHSSFNPSPLFPFEFFTVCTKFA